MRLLLFRKHLLLHLNNKQRLDLQFQLTEAMLFLVQTHTYLTRANPFYSRQWMVEDDG